MTMSRDDKGIYRDACARGCSSKSGTKGAHGQRDLLRAPAHALVCEALAPIRCWLRSLAGPNGRGEIHRMMTMFPSLHIRGLRAIRRKQEFTA